MTRNTVEKPSQVGHLHIILGFWTPNPYRKSHLHVAEMCKRRGQTTLCRTGQPNDSLATGMLSHDIGELPEIPLVLFQEPRGVSGCTVLALSMTDHIWPTLTLPHLGLAKSRLHMSWSQECITSTSNSWIILMKRGKTSFRGVQMCIPVDDVWMPPLKHTS